VATRLWQFSAAELAPSNIGRWQQMRQTIRQRFALCAQGRRYRRNPDAYLAHLVETYSRLALPS
jgi:hypothetical protein